MTALQRDLFNWALAASAVAIVLIVDACGVDAIPPDDGDQELLQLGWAQWRRSVCTFMMRSTTGLAGAVAAPEFASLAGAEITPGVEVESNEDLATYVRQNAQTYFHPVGTCKMGVDEMAVVDPKLRVRGVARLRVADASVMPSVPRANTNAATIMLAEKAADLIRD